jgi:hypothetical protein
MDLIGYTTIVGGDSDFIRAFGIPTAEELEKVAQRLNMQLRQLPDDGIFFVDTRPKNIGTLTTGLFGILLFSPVWFGKKVLDEIYDLKLKPIVREIIKKADGIEIFTSKKKYKTFILSVFYEEYRTLVIVAVKEKAIDDLASNLDKVAAVHVSALAILQERRSSEPVHLYIVSDGKVNMKPYEHKALASALSQIGT